MTLYSVSEAWKGARRGGNYSRLPVQGNRPTDQHLLSIAMLKVVLQEPAHQTTQSDVMCTPPTLSPSRTYQNESMSNF